MKKSLLAHIAGNFISQYENVANSSVTYLLNEYEAARNALASILELQNIPKFYQEELATETNGRPDITGIDENGEKLVIIEGKFWANLTENQPNNYLSELSSQGMLLFLAPEQRIISLTLEIKKRANSNLDNIVLCSWQRFLQLIEFENNKKPNNHLVSDLIQITELCNKMDTEGMPPLTQTDLDPMNGRISAQLVDVISECNNVLRHWEYSDFKGLQSSSSKYYYGFYFRAYQFTCFLSFDINKWYKEPPFTPIWLTIKDKGWKESYLINNAINRLEEADCDGCNIAIALKPSLDKEQTVNFIVENVKAYLIHLNIKVENNDLT